MARWDASQSKEFNAGPFYQYSITQVLCTLETGGQGSPHSDCQPHSTNVSSRKLWSGDEGSTGEQKGDLTMWWDTQDTPSGWAWGPSGVSSWNGLFMFCLSRKFCSYAHGGVFREEEHSERLLVSKNGFS